LANPEKKSGFDALRALVEGNIEQATERFAQVLASCPADKITPAVGMDIATLMQSKPETQSILGPVFDQLESGDTRISKAIKASKKRGK